MTNFNAWWLERIGAKSDWYPGHIVRRLDRYLREHPLPQAVQAPVPFACTPDKAYFLVARDGLYVAVYDYKGRRLDFKSVREFFKELSSSTVAKYSRRILENFHELLSAYVFIDMSP